MKSVNFFLFVVCLVFAAQNVFAADNEINDDEWITMSKEDLCPALHKEVFCTESLLDFEKVAETIENLGKEGVDDDHVEIGKDASKCGDPLKKALCSKDASPLCLEDKTSGDDRVERRVCKELYDTCPAISDQDSLDYTNECAEYLKRKYSDMSCETVGEADFEDDTGCPRPTKKMPAFYIEVYKTKSKLVEPLAEILDGANGFLDKVWNATCLRTVRELPCMPIYCSDDGDTVLLKNKRKDCSRAMGCVALATEKLQSVAGDLVDKIVGPLHDAVKDSCESIIEGFENLASDNDPVNSQGVGVSTAEYSITFTLLAAFFCLKVLW